MKRLITALLLLVATAAIGATISDTPTAPQPLQSTDKVPMGRQGVATAYTATVGQISEYVKAQPGTTTNIVDTATKRFATDAEKAAWNAKQAPLTNAATLGKIGESSGAPTWNGVAWPGGGGSGTASFNGRTSPITPQAGDYNAAQVGADPVGTATANMSAHTTSYDHTNIPTSAQKAALTGTSGAPGAGNKFVTDGDTRLSNSRSPNAHAASHGAGASDPVTVSTSQVTGLDAALAGKQGTLTNAATLGKVSESGNLPLWNGASWPGGSGSGDMYKATYDPQSKNADAFARGNHTGTQPAGTITGLAASATTNTTTTANITDSTDKRFVTDAQRTVLGSTSGTNSGNVTIGTGNGLSLTGQQLSLQPATNAQPGALTAADHTTYSNAASLAATAVQPATSLAGYGITDAYTKTTVDTALGLKANTAALGTAAAKDVPASGNASASQVAMGNDTRLPYVGSPCPPNPVDGQTCVDTAFNLASYIKGVGDSYYLPLGTPTASTFDTITGSPDANSALKAKFDAQAAQITALGNQVTALQAMVVAGGGTLTPTASVSTSTLAFGSVYTGSTGVLTARLTNTGLANLVTTTTTVSGTDAAKFTKTGDGCASQTLAPNAYCDESITFAPTAAGAQSASLSIAHNATGSPTVVALSGTGSVGTGTWQYANASEPNSLGVDLNSYAVGAPVTIGNGTQITGLAAKFSDVGGATSCKIALYSTANSLLANGTCTPTAGAWCVAPVTYTGTASSTYYTVVSCNNTSTAHPYGTWSTATGVLSAISYASFPTSSMPGLSTAYADSAAVAVCSGGTCGGPR